MDSSRKLTKAEIIDSIREDVDLERDDIHRVLNSFFKHVKEALGEDKVIELRGFGTFEIRTRKGREKARNPKTGDIVPVSTHGVAIFRPGKELKKIAWPLRNEE